MILGLILMLAGLVIVVARQELARWRLGTDGRLRDTRREKRVAFFFLIVGTATALAGLTILSLTLES